MSRFVAQVLTPLVLVSACGGGGGQSGTAPSATATPAPSSSSGSASIPIPPPPPSSGSAALALKVHGNTLTDAAGNVVQLRGVNVSGLESVAVQGWSPANPWGGQTGDATPNWNTIKTWQANVVRLPLNEASWLGYPCIDAGGARGTVGATLNPDPGANYQATVAKSVADATSAGLYVIIDLHWTAPANNCPMGQNPMADAANSLTFWTQVATAFKGYPNVVFETFNEPYLYWLASTQTSWAALLSGGTETQFVTAGTPYQVILNWQSAGMQQMVDAIRATGSTNVILIAGVDWAKDLSQWLANKPTDPSNQLGAVWHAYPAYGTTFGTAAYAQPDLAPGIWTQVQGVLAAGFPVVITEFGDHNAAGTASAPFAANLLPWADQNGVSYLAWAWDVWLNADNVLIADAAGTPTSGFGTYVKQHYLCRASASTACL
jgi:aryl-phospho-beta-D-glucosidase BglC (GH1 family)